MKETIVIYHPAEDSRFLHREWVKAKGVQGVVGIPLLVGDRCLGVLTVIRKLPQPFQAEEVELLTAFAAHAAIAVENAKLYEQLKEMTVLEERQRFAREMHDGLAQDLGYLHLKIGELEANPLTSPIHKEIRLMKEVVAGAYEDARQAIFSLKMESPRGSGLVPTLAEYCQKFSGQTGITAVLKIADEEATRHSPEVEVQLIRIVQEALANVRKHSQARHAWVVFDTEGGRSRVAIQDDGQGFDPAQTVRFGGASFGLHTMRERAESVGGKIRVESRGGMGTQVIVLLPMGREDNLSWRL